MAKSHEQGAITPKGIPRYIHVRTCEGHFGT